MQTSLSSLYIYPVKSMQGIACETSLLDEQGLKHDRVLMLTYPNGHFISARDFPILLQFQTALIENGILIIAPDKQTKSITFDAFSPFAEPTTVWNNPFSSHIASISMNRWLSYYLGDDVQLRWIGTHSSRHIKRLPLIPLSFVDSHPILMINRASLRYLQQFCDEKINPLQFRPNFIVDNDEPFSEDRWKTLQINDVIFDVVKPCSRCEIITYQCEKSGKTQKQSALLTLLRQFRQDAKNALDFGHYLIARNAGNVNVGDTVTLLETQKAKKYDHAFATLTPLQTQTLPKTITIEFEGTQFSGNNQQILLEQLENHGVNIPYSCRAGSCGSCRLKLIKGDVLPLNQQAIQKNGYILSCSCIPTSNILIQR